MYAAEANRERRRSTSRASAPKPVPAKAPRVSFASKIFHSAHVWSQSCFKAMGAYIKTQLQRLEKLAPFAALVKISKPALLQLKKLNKQSRAYVAAAMAVMCLSTGIAVFAPAGKAKAETITVDTPGVLTAAAVEALEPIAYYSAEPGLSAPIVADIQQRLMDLGYMGYDEPSEYYGEQTVEAIELFQRRYGLEITGIADEITFGLLFAKDAETYSVSEGVEGDDVKELQERLVELGYLGEATGYFDAATTEAVKKFQARNILTADGTIGQDTREILYSEDANAFAYTYGEANDDIKVLQQRLKDLGYLTTTPDGVYGSDTVAAVKRFQERNGLIADGYLGNMTRSILISDSAQYNTIAIGDSGNDVTHMQQRLVSLGYMKSATGYFGASTEQALKNFQSRNGLSADGKFGAKTNTALFSSSAKKAATTTKKNNTSTSSNTNTNTGSNGSSANISGANVASLISVAESRLGCKYVLGAKGPNQFDCSGLAYWCLKQIGLNQGYMTSYGWRTCTKYQRITSMSDIRAGDIIIYKITSSQGHVAIAVSSDTMIDASTSKGVVVKRTFLTSYWKKYFYCAYRIF